MRFVVCTGDDNGHFVVVEAQTPDEAVELGVEALAAEWPDSYRCRECELPHFFEVVVFQVDVPPVVFKIGHKLERKERQPS